MARSAENVFLTSRKKCKILKYVLGVAKVRKSCISRQKLSNEYSLFQRVLACLLIYLQKSASMQPRASRSKFADSPYSYHPPGSYAKAPECRPRLRRPVARLARAAPREGGAPSEAAASHAKANGAAPPPPLAKMIRNNNFSSVLATSGPFQLYLCKLN